MSQEIKDKLIQMGISPKRSLGQNFLVSEEKIQAIVDCVKRQKNQNLIEIGPGLGALTDKIKLIPERNFKVIELDKEFADHWRKNGLDVEEIDALKFNWQSVTSPTTVVSNLPYQISARITIELTFCSNVKNMIFMYQKEVAQRLQSNHKNEHYGLISAFIQNYWEVEKLIDAGPGDFYPRPNVASRVLFFKRLSNAEIPDEKFLNFVKACFQQRRKLLVKNLKSYGDEKVKTVLAKMDINLKARAEELSPLQIFEMFKQITQ